MRSAGVFFVSVLATLLPVAARAEDDAFGRPLPSVTRYAFGASAGGGFLSDGETRGALAFSFDARLHRGRHGGLLRFGFIPPHDATAGSWFSGPQPSVPATFFGDALYTLQEASGRRMKGFNGALSVEIGPSFMALGSTNTFADAGSGQVLVERTPAHLALGGCAAVHVDFFFWTQMIGLVLGYRGGVPTTASALAPWEGMAFGGLEIGQAFVR